VAPAAGADDAHYIAAAEKFFRPEFFNRLDRVIPFRSLSREQLEGIARQLLGGVVARDGLRRRNGLLNVTPAAMARLVDLGHHPQLGARALKRVVEREVAQPIAEKLAALPPGTPMIANLAARGEGFALSFRDLTPAARSVFWPEATAKTRTNAAQSNWAARILDGAYQALDRIEAELEHDAPAGKIELGALSPAHVRYFFCREHLKRADRLVQVVERGRELPRRGPRPGKLPRARPVKVLVRQLISGNPRFDRERDAVALRHDLAELEPEPVDVPDSPLTALLQELALLEALAARPVDDRPALLVFRTCLLEDSAVMFRLARCYADCLGRIWGSSSADIFEHQAGEDLLLGRILGELAGRTQAVYLKGINLRRFLPDRTNTILTRRADGGTGIVLMTLETVASEAEAKSRAQQMAGSIDTLEPDSFGPVIQTVAEHKTLTDFRTGLVVPGQPSPEEFRALLLSALPLPSEVDGVITQ